MTFFGVVLVAGWSFFGKSCWRMTLFGEVLVVGSRFLGKFSLSEVAFWGSLVGGWFFLGKFSLLKKRFGVFVADGRLGVFVVEQEVWGLAEEEIRVAEWEIRGNTVGKRIGGMGGG